MINVKCQFFFFFAIKLLGNNLSFDNLLYYYFIYFLLLFYCSFSSFYYYSFIFFFFFTTSVEFIIETKETQTNVEMICMNYSCMKHLSSSLNCNCCKCVTIILRKWKIHGSMTSNTWWNFFLFYLINKCCQKYILAQCNLFHLKIYRLRIYWWNNNELVLDWNEIETS